MGPDEKESNNFFHYAQANMGIQFLLKLIVKHNGPINHIACIPNYILCYDNYYNNYNSIEDKNGKLKCPNGLNIFSYDRATIIILNSPTNNNKSNIDMKLIIPDNFKQTINKCKIDNKTIVICELVLSDHDDDYGVVHANCIIINLDQKTIERFDPHGANHYTPDGNEINSSSYDFKFGKTQKNKIKSGATFDQEKIDNYLINKFQNILPDYIYIPINETCPYFGPQSKTDAFLGLCATWTTMYMILKILNPKLNSDIISQKMIIGSREMLLNKVLRFQKFIIETLKEN